MDARKYKTVEEYLQYIPEQAMQLADEMRTAIREAAPKAEETISYNMPGYKLHGVLVYFAAYKGHIGFYPAGSSAIEYFKDELAKYKTSKGAIQFPLDKPIPKTLVKNIVKFRVKENMDNAMAKAAAKKIAKR